MADARKRIIDSVFSKRNATGDLEESYVAHVKIWEDAADAGGRKPRYILLSRASNGTGFIHKSKLNTNGTFSVGKTWKLAELRAIQVIDPLSFNITMSRTYKWQTENHQDQVSFLEALVRLFRTLSGSLHLEGLPDFAVRESEFTPSATSRRVQFPQTANSSEVQRSSTPRPHMLNGSLSSRPASPAGSHRDNRPPSIVVPPHSAIYQRPRQHSNDTVDSARIVASGASVSVRSVTPLQERSRVPSRATNNASPTPSMQPRRPENNNTYPVEAPLTRRDQNARISFFDPVNQAMLDRLLLGNEPQGDVEGDEESARATLASVEEMIEGYEWASDDVIGRKMTKGAVDMIEARLLDELTALEKANIYSLLESDERLAVVMKYIEDGLSELDNIDGLISSYKIHLSAVNDDISFIQSQNRGLQVQTQNQRALLAELQNLLRTVHVDHEALATLTQESLEKTQSIQRLEEAAVQLYKALLAGRDTDMAATMERLTEYQIFNAQFCKRLYDFLSIMFVAQSKLLLGNTHGVMKDSTGPKIVSHHEPEAYLGRYSGLMLYLREMDESVYGKICGSYFSAASDLHNTQIKALLSACLDLVKKATEDDIEQSSMTITRTGTLRRAGTIIKSPKEGRQKDQDKVEGNQRASEVFGICLEQIISAINKEDEFTTEFLQINDSSFTFADYMGLDNYFRRQAARSASMTQMTLKLIRGTLELIFGFVSAELKTWIDAALSKDRMELIGIMALLERFQAETEEKGSLFIIDLLEKQHTRLKMLFDRHVTTQLKGIEQIKRASKKRKGIAQFIRNFPAYASRVESQLAGADSLEIRASVDSAYEKITHAMFESLKQMAKLDGEGEDKGLLNHHIIFIENMSYFVSEISGMDVASLKTTSRKAEAIYEENLTLYVKVVMRKPFAKIIDFFDGVDRVSKGNTNEIASNSSFNKGALRKVTKDCNSKDIKKHIDSLAKRVEKHFTEGLEKDDAASGVTSAKLLSTVWKACESELLKLTQQWSSQISQLYGEGVSLDFTIGDVETAFRRQKLGS